MRACTHTHSSSTNWHRGGQSHNRVLTPSIRIIFNEEIRTAWKSKRLHTLRIWWEQIGTTKVVVTFHSVILRAIDICHAFPFRWQFEYCTHWTRERERRKQTFKHWQSFFIGARSFLNNANGKEGKMHEEERRKGKRLLFEWAIKRTGYLYKF